MKITYPANHTWYKVLDKNSEAYFGKNDRARLRSALKKIEALDITTRIAPLDDAFLDWFVPAYNKTITQKQHPALVDIRTKIESDPVRRKKYYSLSLYENGQILGGTIFFLRKKKLSIAYRIYPHSWNTHTLPANPSLYAEHVITCHAKETGKEILIHGKDRNPYGLHSNIGLAIFKLSIGCYPRVPKKFELCTTDTTQMTDDAFILEYPQDGSEVITKAYLITKRSHFDKWLQVTKYPETLSVEVLYRD